MNNSKMACSLLSILGDREYKRRYTTFYFNEVREKKRMYSKNWIAEKRQKIIKLLGGECVKCGYNSDVRALHIDHINGNGYQERKEMQTNQLYIKILKNETNNYQLLCANCNWIKKYENGEHKNWRI